VRDSYAGTLYGAPMTTLLLVHGNPETDAIWDPLRAHLGDRDVEALSPPGFGAPVPEGFGATAMEYAAWLIGVLEERGDPVDLFGHDWGGGHVIAVAMSRPDLIRSWGCDVAGILDPEYVWHDMAQVWQTPGEGEAAVTAMAETPVEQRVEAFVGLGMTPEAARSCAEAADADMGRCILALYRSAAQPGLADVGRDLEPLRARPGLVVIPEDDPYTGGETLARRTAERAGADIAVLEGVGHWWMLQDPALGATAITNFLDRLDVGG